MIENEWYLNETSMVSEIEKSEGTVEAVEGYPTAEANTFTEIFCG